MNEINKDDDFLNAVEKVEKKHKPESVKKEKKEKLISVKSIGEYKNNELAVTINNFLTKNIDKDAGEILFGENLARTGEYYGLKSSPIIGLIISTIGLIVIMFRVAIKKKKAESNEGNFKHEI